MKNVIFTLLVVSGFLFAACDKNEAVNLEDSGRFDVYTKSISIPNSYSDNVNGTVYLPSLDGGENIADGKFPLIIMLPGFGVSYTLYSNYSRHMASWGYAVLGIDFPKSGAFNPPEHDRNAKEVILAIDSANSPESPLYGIIDQTKIGVCGHSKGGKIAFFAAAIDQRIGVVMSMDPQNGGGAPCFVQPNKCHLHPVAPNPKNGDEGIMADVTAASVIFRAPPDPLVTPEEQFNASYFWQGLESNGLFVDMNVRHIAWISNATVMNITRRTMIAWLKRHFNNEPGMERYFTGNVMQVDIDSGMVVKVETK